jgi:hypothetical protein
LKDGLKKRGSKNEEKGENIEFKNRKPSWKEIILKHRGVFPLENLRKTLREK